MALQQGQLVWAWITGFNKTARRACVVITTSPDGRFVEVVYGQGSAYRGCSCPVAVSKDSELGKRLQLSKETHFCGMQVIPISSVTRVMRDPSGPLWCPVSEFAPIEAVAIDARRQISRRANAARPTAAAPNANTPTAPSAHAPAAAPAPRTSTPSHVDPPVKAAGDPSDD